MTALVSRQRLIALCSVLLTPALGAAQSRVTLEPRIGFFVPGADLVKFESPVTPNVELEPGPLAGAEALFTLRNQWLGFYGSFQYGVSQLEHTSALNTQTPAQPSSDVDVLLLTTGVSLTPSLWPHLRPRLVLGGGIKGYNFDLLETDGLSRFTFEYGVGVTAAPTGAWESAAVLITAEFRQYTSSFQPTTLPIGLGSTTEQRQFDNVVTLGLRVRLGQPGGSPQP